MDNRVVWFEIPVTDLDRAKKFYSEVFEVEMSVMEHDGTKMAMFPFEQGVASGGLIKAEGYKPADTGTRIYLNGGEDLSAPLSKIESSGGTVVKPKYSLGPNGFAAEFKDTEGNIVCLHSRK